MVQPIKNFFSWRKKCCQLPFRSWCGRPATMFQKLPEKNTIITKEPNVSSWDLGDGRYIVVSRIFCLRRFCSYTVHPRKKKRMEKYGTNYSSPFRSMLCISWTYQLFRPCPKTQEVNIPTPFWKWMGKEQSACVCLLLAHAIFTLQAKAELLLKCNATFYISLINALTV